MDQLLYLAESPAKRVSCALRTIASLGDAEDVVKAVIETESGMVLDIDISLAAAQPLVPWQILGSRGSIRLNNSGDGWLARYFDPEVLGDGVVHRDLAAPDRRYGNIDEVIPWQEIEVPLSDFAPVDFYGRCYAFYALDQAPFVSVEETLATMRVLDSCRRNAAGFSGPTV